jgi:uncharacterized protein
MAVLVDTGILYALADAGDAWHQRVLAWTRRTRDVLLAPVTVLPEAAYLFRTRLGPAAERVFVESLAAGELAIEPLLARDLSRSLVLLAEYPELGLVDVTIVAMAERLKVATIATTDRRHFSRVRPAHAAAFRLVPE